MLNSSKDQRGFKIIGGIVYSVSLLVFFVLVGCADSLQFKGSKSSNVEPVTPPAPAPDPDPIIHDDNTTKELKEILNTASQEEKREFIKEHLDAKNTEGKPVKVCLWFNGSGHNCDFALFHVFFNVDPDTNGKYDAAFADPVKLDLNNGTSGPHVGISGVTYTVPGNNSTYGWSAVPGTLYTGYWNNEGKLNIVTTCALSSCHNGIASMSVIGKMVVKYKGSSAEVTFIDKRTKIKTTAAVTYDLANQDYEIASDNVTFDDWCQIVDQDKQ